MSKVRMVPVVLAVLAALAGFGSIAATRTVCDTAADMIGTQDELGFILALTNEGVPAKTASQIALHSADRLLATIADEKEHGCR